MIRVSVVVLTLATAAAHAQWSAVTLNPTGASMAGTRSVAGGRQGGWALLGGIGRATLWNGAANPTISLHPTGAVGGSIVLGMSGTQQVGSATFNGDAETLPHAGLWSGTAASWVDLNPAGIDGSAANATNGTQQAGHTYVGYSPRAALWSGTAASWVSLHPTGARESSVEDIDGSKQVGYVAASNGVYHAALWSGTAASWTSLNPVGATGGEAHGVYGTQQVGRVIVGGESRASLWTGSAASWVNLNPAGAVRSEALDIFGGYQVGHVSTGGAWRAGLWSGTAASWEDLSLVLPGSWTSSHAHCVWTDGSTLYVGGYGERTGSTNSVALLWTKPIPTPGTLAALGLGTFVATRRRR